MQDKNTDLPTVVATVLTIRVVAVLSVDGTIHRYGYRGLESLSRLQLLQIAAECGAELVKRSQRDPDPYLCRRGAELAADCHATIMLSKLGEG